MQNQTLTIDDALKLAVAHHRKGRLNDAEKLYRAILAANPSHPDANHNLGVICFSVGQPEAALPFIQRALESVPSHQIYAQTLKEVEAIINKRKIQEDLPTQTQKVLELYNRGRYAEALPIVQKLVNEYPNFAMGYNILGAICKSLGMLESAKNAFERFVLLEPQNAEAYNNLGVTLSIIGAKSEAVDAYQKALSLKPDYAEAHINLGNSLNTIGKNSEAIEACQKALSLKPDYAEAYNNIGNGLNALGKHTEAIVAYQKALSLKPDYTEAHNNLGNVLYISGYYNDAVKSYKKAVSLDTNYAEAYNNLGVVLNDLALHHEAAEACKRAITLKPDFAEAYNNLGNALNNLGKQDDAIEAFNKAISMKSDFTEAYSNLGNVLCMIGREDEAAGFYEKAISLKPDYANSYAGLANIASSKGDFEKSNELIYIALEIEPDSMPSLALIPQNKKMDSVKDEWWIQRALSLLESKRLNPSRDRYSLLYSVGKYFDDTREYDKSFEYYTMANELKSAVSLAYEADSHSSQNDKIVSSYTREFIAHPQNSNLSALPLFIIGMPRSGTSLVEQILSSHPLTFGAGELYFWPDIVEKYTMEFLEGEFGDKLLDHIATECLTNLKERSKEIPQALRVVDKMPGNFLYVGLIHSIFPNAKFIHTMRNPIDTCLSIYFQNFNATHKYANDLEDLAHFYREYHRLMEHWRAVLPEGVMLDVRYEDIVEDQEGWSRKIIEHIGLEWDDRCLDFYKTERKVGTASNWQVKQPIYKSSKERWRNYEKYVGSLKGLLDIYTKGDAPMKAREAYESELATLFAKNDFLALEQKAEEMLRVYPDSAFGYKALGISKMRLAKNEEAVYAFKKSLEYSQNDHEVCNIIGNLTAQKGDREGAKKFFEAALATKPDYADALYNLGNIYYLDGDYQKAIELYKRTVTYGPNFAGAYSNMGLAYKELGEYESALSCLKKSVEIEPNNAALLTNLAALSAETGRNEEALDIYLSAYGLTKSCESAHHVGVAYQKIGRYDEALAYFLEAIKTNPNYVPSYIEIGNTYKTTLKYDEAIKSYQKAIEIEPSSANALNNLGAVYIELYEMDEAIKYIEMSLAIDDSNASAYNNLGAALKNKGRYEEARERYVKAISIDPQMADAYNNFGKLMSDLCFYTEAVGLFKKAIELKPDYAEAYNNLGVAFAGLDNVDKARRCYEKSIELGKNLDTAYMGLSIIANDAGDFELSTKLAIKAMEIDPKSLAAHAMVPKNKKMDDNEEGRAWLEQAKGLLSVKTASEEAKYTLEFAIGKYYDDIKKHDDAFAHYSAANAIKKEFSIKYSGVEQEKLTNDTIFFYGRQNISVALNGHSNSSLPLFIVGMPRSGTSLTEQILSSHPLTFGAGELLFWNNVAKQYKNEYLKEVFGEGTVSSIADGYLTNLKERSKDKPEALRVVDKMPGNFLHIGFIHSVFPNAKFIHTMRNPIDTCLSIYFQNFNATHKYANDLEDLAHFYREYHRLMEHWRAVLPEGVMLDVRYEDIVEDQEGWSRKIIEHIGLEWDDRCLDFYKTERKVGTASNWQVKQPIYKSSKERWRNYEKFVEPLMGLLELY